MIFFISCLYLCIIEPLQNLRARQGAYKIGLSPIPSFYIFSLVQVTDWPPIGKQLLTRLTICFIRKST